MADLRALYTAIHQRSTPVAQEGLLSSPPEFCKAIWALGDWQPTAAFTHMMRDLQPLCEEGILFDISGTRGGQLHWTLFQLQTFPVDPSAGDISALHQEAAHLQRILYQYPPLQLRFEGIAKTRFGLFLCGFPSFDITPLRDQIRREVSGIREPHPQDICHATLFRFTREPSELGRQLLEEVCARYSETPLLEFTPTRWEYGFGTWLQLERRVLRSWAPPPRWILHRGLKAGPDRTLENREELLRARLEEGWDVEIDVWFHEGAWWLGHDAPTVLLRDLALLVHPRVWVHCKNLAALIQIPAEAHCFSHDLDPAVLTSWGWIWCYPGQLPASARAVYVLPERCGSRFPQLAEGGAVCSDYLPTTFL
jgi:hypothetical protein